MRASTGNAVIDIATPRNSAKLANGTSLVENRGYRYRASAAPRTNGSDDAGCEMATVARSCPRSSIRVQLEPDQEHVEDDAQLRDDAERRRHGRRQDERACRGPDRAEQRWPEQDAGNHFADHRRLPDRGEQPAQQAAGDDDRGQRDAAGGSEHSAAVCRVTVAAPPGPAALGEHQLVDLVRSVVLRRARRTTTESAPCPADRATPSASTPCPPCP